jgi:cell division protein FtsB
VADVRWGLVAVPVVCFVLGAGAVLVSDERSGLGALVELRSQVRDAQARGERLGSEERRLAGEIRSLREDDLAVEAAARTALGMVRPGEIVVRLDPVEAGR